MPQFSLEFIKKGYQLLKENTKIQPYYTRNWLLLSGFANGLIENEENPEIKEELKKEANYFLERAHRLSPKRQEIFIERIKNNLIIGEYQKAKEKSQECIELNEKLADCWWYLGLSNLYLAESERAKENIDIAGRKNYPIYSESSFLQLVKVYALTKNYQKLIEVHQELIKINPNEARYYASLAFVYKELGQLEEAKKQALKIIELFPEHEKTVEEFLKTLE